MKKFILSFLALSMLGALNVSAQVYFKSTTFENPDFSLIIDEVVSTYSSIKLRLKITNKTADFLTLKPAECVFKVNGKNSSSIDNDLNINPNSSDTRVFTLPGNGFDQIQNFAFVMSGLYKISTAGPVVKAPDFKLPPGEILVFKVGDAYNCAMDTLIKTSDKTSVTFDCLYEGSKIGMINPAKVAVSIPNGNEYPNAKINDNNPATKGKSDILMLTKGQTVKTTFEWGRMPGGKATDMAKIDMTILFKDAFSETSRQKLGALTFELKYDEAKNKQ